MYFIHFYYEWFPPNISLQSRYHRSDPFFGKDAEMTQHNHETTSDSLDDLYCDYEIREFYTPALSTLLRTAKDRFIATVGNALAAMI
jgi:hypothetical protein